MTQRYAKLKTAAYYIDASEDFLEKRMGKDFIEGIHYFRPANCNLPRWDLLALDEWMRTSSYSSESPKNNLLISRMAA